MSGNINGIYRSGWEGSKDLPVIGLKRGKWIWVRLRGKKQGRANYSGRVEIRSRKARNLPRDSYKVVGCTLPFSKYFSDPLENKTIL